jgi:hypothetical protein
MYSMNTTEGTTWGMKSDRDVHRIPHRVYTSWSNIHGNILILQPETTWILRNMLHTYTGIPRTSGICDESQHEHGELQQQTARRDAHNESQIAHSVPKQLQGNQK